METKIIEQEIKNILIDKMSNSIHAKVNKLNDRIDMLLNIHRSWIAFAKYKLTDEEIADTLYKYDKNICEY
jgi:hypothetical protein